MNRKTRRINSQFHKLIRSKLAFHDLGRDQKVIWVFRMHLDSVNQTIIIVELLLIKGLLHGDLMGICEVEGQSFGAESHRDRISPVVQPHF